MERISWREAVVDMDCPNCMTLGGEGKLVRSYELLSGNEARVDWACSFCTFTDSAFFTVPDGRASIKIVLPRPSEVEAYAAPVPKPKPSLIAVPRPPKPAVDGKEMMELAQKNLPKLINVGGYAVSLGVSLLPGPVSEHGKAPDLVRVVPRVSNSGAMDLSATILDGAEGEPDWKEVLADISRNAEAGMGLTMKDSGEIRIVQRRGNPRGIALCGNCGKLKPCGCQGDSGAGLNVSALAPQPSVASNPVANAGLRNFLSKKIGTAN